MLVATYILSIGLYVVKKLVIPHELVLLDVCYKQTSKEAKVVGEIFNVLSILAIFIHYIFAVWVLIFHWSDIKHRFWYIIACIVSIIIYAVIVELATSSKESKNDKLFKKEIDQILSGNAVWNCITEILDTDLNINSVYFANDGVAFFYQQLEDIEYPDSILEEDWYNAYKAKYIQMGKYSVAAATKRRCKEWEENIKQEWATITSIKCDIKFSYSDFGYTGISFNTKKDLCRLLCNKYGLQEKIFHIKKKFYEYHIETYNGSGTVNGSSITIYSTPDASRVKDEAKGSVLLGQALIKHEKKANHDPKTHVKPKEKLL